ncbi:MAG: hypothetical protein J7M26_04105, partial [Armatimonadetes bacterium]|nr:hypothetical protein [Armatimonadota bacterium]
DAFRAGYITDSSTVIIITSVDHTVLLSVIYPARKASDIAMPGIERSWSLPEPEDDTIRMDLPFSMTGDQAIGVNAFLQEYLAAHADYSLGHFSTADITFHRIETERGEGYELDLMVWLAPYDLGVWSGCDCRLYRPKMKRSTACGPSSSARAGMRPRGCA